MIKKTASHKQSRDITGSGKSLMFGTTFLPIGSCATHVQLRDNAASRRPSAAMVNLHDPKDIEVSGE
jgi:hypothetical protein